MAVSSRCDWLMQLTSRLMPCGNHTLDPTQNIFDRIQKVPVISHQPVDYASSSARILPRSSIVQLSLSSSVTPVETIYFLHPPQDFSIMERGSLTDSGISIEERTRDIIRRCGILCGRKIDYGGHSFKPSGIAAIPLVGQFPFSLG
jgi:hypothetical protein